MTSERVEQVVCADCLEHMRTMPDDCIDAIVTDPPYGISFMGAEWDSYGGKCGNESVEERKAKSRTYADEHKGAARYGNSHGKQPKVEEMVAFQRAMTPVFKEALRIAKPGAHMLCFGGTRTYHRITCAIEEAGWTVKDCIMWVYGSGMPHGQRVERLMEKKYPDEAPKWGGWNTQLKPAWEPIVVACKPFKGGVAKNAVTYGTGAMNIDACRVPSEPHDASRDGEMSRDRRYDGRGGTNFRNKPGPRGGDPKGRFPANLVHDGSQMVLELFPESKGQLADVRAGIPRGPSVDYGEFGPTVEYLKRNESCTSAARFFYCAKASKKDRGEGNIHPTCKPSALMEWLVTLVTRDDAIVLDPFAGSGTTLVAAKRLGRSFIGIEKSEEYCEIIRSRLERERVI